MLLFKRLVIFRVMSLSRPQVTGGARVSPRAMLSAASTALLAWPTASCRHLAFAMPTPTSGMLAYARSLINSGAISENDA